MSTTVWPSRWNAASRSRTNAKPRWMSGEGGSTPSFTRNGFPRLSFSSSAPAGRTSTACRVRRWIVSSAIRAILGAREGGTAGSRFLPHCPPFGDGVEPVHIGGRTRGVMTVCASPVVASTRQMARELAHLSDEAVLALVARSEEAALAEIYDRFGAVAYGLALRVLRDEGLAQDAVQDAFLAVWRTAASFSPERGAARTWVLTLVHRRAVDLVRREERRRGDPLESAPEPASDELTDQQAWLRFERERVQAALTRLPDQRRGALEGAYWGGFSQPQRAERLGEPLGTIKSRMHTGLARLRELLAEPMPEERTWEPK